MAKLYEKWFKEAIHQAAENNVSWETRNNWDKRLHSSVYCQVRVFRPGHYVGNHGSAHRPLLGSNKAAILLRTESKIHRTEWERCTQREISENLQRIPPSVHLNTDQWIHVKTLIVAGKTASKRMKRNSL